MPTGMALLILVLAPVTVHVLKTRLAPVIALFYGAFLLLILAVPINLGEGVTALSFAKFYNRIGWAALGILLVMYLRPREARAGRDRLDAACAACLTLLMVYTKATYGLAALGFLSFMLFDRRQWRWAAGALAASAAGGLLIELVWRSSTSYIADLQFALSVSGGLRGTWGQITDHILGNLSDYVLMALLAGLALKLTHRFRDVLFYVLCAVVGFLLINQNFQAWGIITLHAAGAVAAETILRRSDDKASDPAQQRWSLGAGAKLLFIAFVLPTIVHCIAALGLHAAAASTGTGDRIALPRMDRVRLANFWTWGEHDAANRYLASIQDGMATLAALDSRPEHVVVLDNANPFSAALALMPPKGDSPWLQWERTVGASAFIPAEDLLADARIVMEPKQGTEDLEGGGSPAALYAPHLSSGFELVRETDHWRAYRRREPTERTSCRDGCESDVAVTREAGQP